MARPPAGTQEKLLELTQRLCWLVRFQSGLPDSEIEELFGFGAVKPSGKNSGDRRGESFNRYINGQRAMSPGMMQSIALKAIKQPWWKLNVSTDGFTGDGCFGSAELIPMLGDLGSGERLTETLKEMHRAKKQFEREQLRLLNSIKDFQTALNEVSALKFAMIGRSEVEEDQAMFADIEDDNFAYDLRKLEERLCEYRVEFIHGFSDLLSNK